jgi:hypothetical protein
MSEKHSPVKRWSDRELRSPCDDAALDALLARIDGVG